MSSQRSRGTVLSASLVLALISGTVPAATDEAVIEYRQKILAATGGHFGAVQGILKHKLPHGTERIAEHARLLQGSIAMIASAFKQETPDIKTDAKPTIWKEWDTFETKISKLQAEAEKLEKIAATGTPQEINFQFLKVALSCKSCHDDYRKPKEQSWKNAK